MTREEAIAFFKDMSECTYGNLEPVEMAIKALEQEPVLDKIRAEIVEMRSKQNCSCSDCLDIIDRYRAESKEV